MPDIVTLVLLVPIELAALIIVAMIFRLVVREHIGHMTIPVLLVIALTFWKLVELLYITVTRLGG